MEMVEEDGRQVEGNRCVRMKVTERRDDEISQQTATSASAAGAPWWVSIVPPWMVHSDLPSAHL